MRLLSEQLFMKDKYEDLVEKAGIIRDYGCEVVVPVKTNLLEKAKSFADRMNAKEVGVNFWPLADHYLSMFANRYWVNSFTAKSVANLLQKMKPVIEKPNVNSIILDMESFFPLLGYLANKEKARDILEKAVDEIQKDCGKPAVVMEWLWPSWVQKTFNHPIPRNAKKHTYMIYTSMMLSRFAPRSSREKNFESRRARFDAKIWGRWSGHRSEPHRSIPQARISLLEIFCLRSERSKGRFAVLEEQRGQVNGILQHGRH
jgi:hypothetical protein